jgi:cysteine-rich repeat protein
MTRGLCLGGLLVALGALGPGCSVIVESELENRRPDAGMMGETCTFDAQCISFDPFNCNRICGPEGRCIDGPAPDGTRCGMGANQHCVANVCVMRECGDRFVDRSATPPEFCDDGNDNPDDGCNNVCTRSCAPPAPAMCSDGNPCNGEETCADVAGMMLCRASMALAEGATCTSAGGDGTCTDGFCVTR